MIHGMHRGLSYRPSPAFAASLPCEALRTCSVISTVGFLHDRDIIPHLRLHPHALRPGMPTMRACQPACCAASVAAAWLPMVTQIRPDWLSTAWGGVYYAGHCVVLHMELSGIRYLKASTSRGHDSKSASIAIILYCLLTAHSAAPRLCRRRRQSHGSCSLWGWHF